MAWGRGNCWKLRGAPGACLAVTLNSRTEREPVRLFHVGSMVMEIRVGGNAATTEPTRDEMDENGQSGTPTET